MSCDFELKQPISNDELSQDVQAQLDLINTKITANNPITASTKTKITYDTKGLITAGDTLIPSDIPSLTLSKISDAGTVANKDTGTDAGEIPILDAQGKLLIDVIPISVVNNQYKGVWDASSGVYPATPTLINGDYWKISVSGIIEATPYNKNDEMLWNGSSFDRIDNNELVTFAQDISRCGFTNLTDTETPYLSGVEYDIVNLDDSGAGWSYYYNGIKYTITGNKTVELTGGAGNAHDHGIHWVYINNEIGTLATSTTVPDITTNVIVAYVFWNQSLDSGKRSIIADERHTIAWDSNVHKHFHLNYGAKLRSGGNISGYTLESVTDAHKQYSLTSAILEDEDLIISATPLVGGSGQYTNLFRTASGVWGWTQDNNFPFRYTTSSRLIYDNATISGATCSSGKYINTYVIISNLAGQARYFNITSQTEYSTLNLALNATFSDLDLTGLDIPEYVVLDKLTWFTDDSLSGTGKCKLMHVSSIRKNYKELYNISLMKTCDIDDCEDRRYVTDANLVVLNNTSGTNSGDETTNTIKTKLGVSNNTTDGYLTLTDWNTFNNKQSALGYTPANSILYAVLYENTITGTTLNLTAINTYYQWISSSVGVNSGITLSSANDNITIDTTGIYKVNINATLTQNKNNNRINVALYKNSTTIVNTCYAGVQSNINTYFALSVNDILSLTSGDTLDVRFSANVANTILTIYNINFNIMRIG